MGQTVSTPNNTHPPAGLGASPPTATSALGAPDSWLPRLSHLRQRHRWAARRTLDNSTDKATVCTTPAEERAPVRTLEPSPTSGPHPAHADSRGTETAFPGSHSSREAEQGSVLSASGPHCALDSAAVRRSVTLAHPGTSNQVRARTQCHTFGRDPGSTIGRQRHT